MAKKPIRPLRTHAEYDAALAEIGVSRADLGRLSGSRQRASDVLSRKRALTMQMAWRLNRDWGIPAEALLSSRDRKC
jgi:HTH-type transcriptional regulator/antitoxin HigA